MVYPLTQWLGAAAGADCALAACQSWRLLEEFPLLRASRCLHLEIWTLPSPSYLSVLRCLGVACEVRRIFGTHALLGLMHHQQKRLVE